MEQVNIRSIQHYLYCPHRWGLMEIGRVWAENAFVVKADLLHDRVHDPENTYTTKGKKVFTSVAVYNDDLNIFGVTDCIEAVKSNTKGENSTTNYDYTVVEYKPTAPKDKDFNVEDAFQVFAQKVCVDYIFNTNSEAVIYYADVKKRVNLPFQSDYEYYYSTLKQILNDIQSNLEKGIIPPILKNQKCDGCSLKDLCMPKGKAKKPVNAQIHEILEDDT